MLVSNNCHIPIKTKKTGIAPALFKSGCYFFAQQPAFFSLVQDFISALVQDFLSLLHSCFDFSLGFCCACAGMETSKEASANIEMIFFIVKGLRVFVFIFCFVFLEFEFIDEPPKTDDEVKQDESEDEVVHKVWFDYVAKTTVGFKNTFELTEFEIRQAFSLISRTRWAFSVALSSVMVKIG